MKTEEIKPDDAKVAEQAILAEKALAEKALEDLKLAAEKAPSPGKTRRITVVKPFTLTVSHGAQKRYEVGTYDVSEEIANHWYTKAHLKAAASQTPALPGGSVLERPTPVDFEAE